ncbi:hypothetical protein [Cellulosimicrobium arenosum]|uniref:Uncharacterized protein n=1 Tax=Cellulosimicrobium arenosum TaxID=2708133 RepID=A0A927IZV6_9MICO|nr:hypothetical protein [Cellulosimicrobium arenosum]MBD8079149.1 hypothetical protein [Cellulosimicrobium arenosum]
MSWDWVPARPGEDPRDGPSPALRRVVTVLVVLVTAVFVVYYATIGLGQGEDRCVAERPQGVSAGQVEARWRWWPPGTACVYPTGDVTRA